MERKLSLLFIRIFLSVSILLLLTSCPTEPPGEENVQTTTLLGTFASGAVSGKIEFEFHAETSLHRRLISKDLFQITGLITLDNESISISGTYNSSTGDIVASSESPYAYIISDNISSDVSVDEPAVLEITSGDNTGTVMAVPIVNEEDNFEVFTGIYGNWQDIDALELNEGSWPVNITELLNVYDIDEVEVYYKPEGEEWKRQHIYKDGGDVLADLPGFIEILGTFNMTVPNEGTTEDIVLGTWSDLDGQDCGQLVGEKIGADSFRITRLVYNWDMNDYEDYPVDARIYDYNSVEGNFVIMDRRAEGFWDDPDNEPGEDYRMAFMSIWK